MNKRDIEKQQLETRLGIEVWLLTAAQNFIASQEPAIHHPKYTHLLWAAAKQDVLTLLRAELNSHLERFEAEDAQRRAAMAQGRSE